MSDAEEARLSAGVDDSALLHSDGGVGDDDLCADGDRDEERRDRDGDRRSHDRDRDREDERASSSYEHDNHGGGASSGNHDQRRQRWQGSASGSGSGSGSGSAPLLGAYTASSSSSSSDGASAKKVYVENLPLPITDEILRSLFAPYGEIVRIHIGSDRATGRQLGFAFVEMGEESEGRNAIESMHGFEASPGRKLRCSVAKQKAQQRDHNTSAAGSSNRNYAGANAANSSSASASSALAAAQAQAQAQQQQQQAQQQMTFGYMGVGGAAQNMLPMGMGMGMPLGGSAAAAAAAGMGMGMMAGVPMGMYPSGVMGGQQMMMGMPQGMMGMPMVGAGATGGMAMMPGGNMMQTMTGVGGSAGLLGSAVGMAGSFGGGHVGSQGGEQQHAQQQQDPIPPSANVFVNGIPFSWSESDLSDHFRPFGEVTHVKLLTDMTTGKSKGSGFVHFISQDCAAMAIQTWHGKKAPRAETFLQVRYALPKKGAAERQQHGGNSSHYPQQQHSAFGDDSGHASLSSPSAPAQSSYSSSRSDDLSNGHTYGPDRKARTHAAGQRHNPMARPTSGTGSGNMFPRANAAASSGGSQTAFPSSFTSAAPQGLSYMDSYAPSGGTGTSPATYANERGEYVLFVFYMPKSMTVEEMKLLFSKYGHISQANIPRDSKTGESKGFGFVNYKNFEEAQNVSAHRARGNKSAESVECARSLRCSSLLSSMFLYVFLGHRWHEWLPGRW